MYKKEKSLYAFMEKQLSVIISGFVQGVGYRYYTKFQAASLGIKGYVQNLPDGKVKIIAEGEEAVLQQFLDLLREGPESAIVKKIIPKWGKASGQYKGFQIEF